LPTDNFAQSGMNNTRKQFSTIEGSDYTNSNNFENVSNDNNTNANKIFLSQFENNNLAYNTDTNLNQNMISSIENAQ